jgi:hypothetical protein
MSSQIWICDYECVLLQPRDYIIMRELAVIICSNKNQGICFVPCVVHHLVVVIVSLAPN